MTEEQRRFKILKKTSYEEQISQENKRATTNALILGVFAAMAVNGFAQNIDVTNSELIQFLNFASAIVDSVFGAVALKKLIEAISRKTMLQGKVDDINAELAMPENEESKGMRR